MSNTLASRQIALYNKIANNSAGPLVREVLCNPDGTPRSWALTSGRILRTQNTGLALDRSSAPRPPPPTGKIPQLWLKIMLRKPQ